MSSGLLLVDKPAGKTSHDIVAEVRKRFGSKVGHAGTLDPMATGLMLIGVGSATRVLQYLVGLDKSYRATIRLGWATDTDDATGQRTDSPSGALPTDDEVLSRLESMQGQQLQLPSKFSAKKIGGRRAYDLARAGEQFELKPVEVTLYSLRRVGEIRRSPEFVELDVDVACSSGTYIRAIARDLGEDLGCGGHLTALRRTRIGDFELADAAPPDEAKLLPLAQCMAKLFPLITLNDVQSEDFRHGRAITLNTSEVVPSDATRLAARDERGGALGVLERNREVWQPKIVFAEQNIA